MGTKKIHSVAVSPEVSQRIELMDRGELGVIVEDAIITKYPLSTNQLKEKIDGFEQEIEAIKKRSTLSIQRLQRQAKKAKDILKSKQTYRMSQEEKEYFQYAKKILKKDPGKIGPQLKYYNNSFKHCLSLEEYKELMESVN